MKRSRAGKARTHSKIVAVAAKRFRERGIEGIGIADVMKEAGSSVGGFYKHFNSREELVIEALAELGFDVISAESPSAVRIFLMVVFSPSSKSTKVSAGQILLRSSSRVTTSPAR